MGTCTHIHTLNLKELHGKILKTDYKIIGNMKSWKLTMALPEHKTFKH